MKPTRTEIPTQCILRTKISKKCFVNNQRKITFVTALAGTSDSGSEELSRSEAILEFYACINEKNLKQLQDFISENCILEDSTFPYKFEGKQEVLGFFTHLAQSMGKNVQFRTGHVCVGDELTASVDWHLEWKKDQIPFSRGCSIFQFSEEGDKLVIRKAQIITESPIKPGKLTVALLKMVTSIFDDYPKVAEWFLKSPHTILKAAMNIYNLFVAPILNPILMWYINLWKFMTWIFGYIICILHSIAKLFNQGSSRDDANTSS